jgi:uncharacterized membrane protein YbjE (DUF340 family)
MFVAAVVVSVLLAALLVLSALIKITRREPFVQGYLRVGLREQQLNYLAALLLAAAAGVLIGLWWAPVGIAATIGLVLYFLLAIGAHVRADDARNLASPIVFALLAALSFVLRLVTL